MSFQLSDEQLKAAASSGDPVELFDPKTNATFVLLRSDVYQSILHSELATVRSMFPLINELMANDDANDPLLESYQHYATDES